MAIRKLSEITASATGSGAPVLRKNSIQLRNLTDTGDKPSAQPLYVIVCEKPAVIVRLQPVVEMNLIQVRTHKFFPQPVRLAANEWHLQSSKHGNQKLGRPIGIDTRMGIRRFDLTQCARDYQQPMRIAGHEAEAVDEGSPFD